MYRPLSSCLKCAIGPFFRGHTDARAYPCTYKHKTSLGVVAKGRLNLLELMLIQLSHVTHGAAC